MIIYDQMTMVDMLTIRTTMMVVTGRLSTIKIMTVVDITTTRTYNDNERCNLKHHLQSTL